MDDDDELVPQPEAGEKRLNIHLDPADIAGVYANFANISFSRYEFTLTFARIEHEIEEGDVPGAVVSRINASPLNSSRSIVPRTARSWLPPRQTSVRASISSQHSFGRAP